MHKIIDKKFYLGPIFGSLLNKKWITISELLHAIDSKIRRVQKLFLAPCRRGESPPEVFFIAMLAFGAMSE
jgi:hypothetical protein